MEKTVNNTNIDYGKWRRFSLGVVCCSFLIMFVNPILSGSSLFTTYLPDIYGWDRSSIALPYTMGGLLKLVLTFFTATAFARYDPRKIIPLGTLFYGIAMLLMSNMGGNYSIYFAAAIICGLGEVILNLGGTFVLCGNWFNKKLGTVLGIVTIGAPLCNGFMMNAIVRYIATFSDTATGLKLVTSFLGYFCLFLSVLFYIIIRGKPEDIGFYPDGETTPLVKKNAESLKTDWTLKRILTNRYAVTLYIGFGLLSFITSGVMNIFIRALVETGMETVSAANYLTLASVLAILLSFVSGIIDDRIGTRTATLIAAAFYVILGISMYIVVRTGNTLAILVAAVGIGFGIGTVPNLNASYTNRLFGRANLMLAHRYLSIISGGIALVSGSTIGYIYDAAGSYGPAFILCAVLAVVAFVLIFGCNKSFSEDYIAAHNGDDRIR
ncbi:MAG: MFS transporter [Lachnospiraceae bacterium]|nr:MFS transporter [Lachnospiraceae bacterium]